MSSANTLTIAQARDALRARTLSAAELTEACLTAASDAKALNAFVHDTPEIAQAQAAAADARLASGDAPALCGIPLGIKDLFCTRGVPSQAASNILAGFKPEYESTLLVLQILALLPDPALDSPKDVPAPVPIPKVTTLYRKKRNRKETPSEEAKCFFRFLRILPPSHQRSQRPDR